MARLSKATYVKNGYGQVEPNHLSAQRNGQIYAQLPAASTIDVLENGQFVKYDYANKEVNYTGEGEWMLVYNEVKVYKDFETNKDFALTTENQVRGIITPRVFATHPGDIITTNCIKATEVEEKDYLTIGADGYLAPAEGLADSHTWQVVQVYTMPDGQPGAKIVRVN